ncbi:MAG: zf-HC2 domain-containing protein [Gammaproteobacteria bacterium]
MNCKQATQQVSQKQDRTLSIKEQLTLRFHLAMCSGCRNYNRQIKLIRKACSHISGQE